MVLRPHCGHQVDEKCEDVEGENQRDNPFLRSVLVRGSKGLHNLALSHQHCCSILAATERGDNESYRHSYLDKDKCELQPKRPPQDTVLAEVHAQSLVLRTYKNS